MRVSTLISAVLLSNVIFNSGCAINRADSLKMLDRRAEYQTDNTNTSIDPGLKEGGLDGFSSGPVPVRSRPKVAAIWIHAHEMASHDYFWGGWMSVVVEPDQWLLSKPGSMPQAPGVSDVTGLPPPKLPARIPGEFPRLKMMHKTTNSR